MSEEGGESKYAWALTETTVVEEAEEPVVRRLKGGVGVTRTGDDLLHHATKNVRDDLKEKLGHEDGLRTEVLLEVNVRTLANDFLRRRVNLQRSVRGRHRSRRDQDPRTTS